MLNKIIAFSINNKLIVGLLVLALVATGAYHVNKLPIDAVPDITNNQVLVITPSPSLGAADIERLITFPIEQATINIPGIIEQRSFSRFGLSLVTIVFDEETDVYWARQQVSERMLLLQNDIPPGLGKPTLGPVTTGLGEIFQYVVRPKKGYEHVYTPMELRTIQDWIIRRQLLGTPGVADVSSFGGKLKQYEIAVNYNKLRSYNLTISDVFTALEKNNQNTGGAYIEKGPTVLSIRSEGLIQNEEDINSITVKRLPDGTPVTIRDVATLQYGTATRYGAVTFNDQGEVAGAIVMMLKGANSSKVIKDVKERIARIETTLPEGVIIEPFLDRTKMVNNAISTVQTNLLEGALIVVLVLVLFLGNLRAGLLVASVIPLSMLFAVIMMNVFGVSGNLMSLGALDFGLIIDGAVIIVEAVMHRLHKNKYFAGVLRINQQQMNEEVKHAAGKMMNAAVFGQIIILIVYLPILSLQGIEGKMFTPMAQTVAFAIIGAFLLSLTYIPMMSALVLSKKLSHKDNLSDRLMRRIERFYKGVLKKALMAPAAVVSTSVAMFGVALLILSTLGGEFIPKLEEGDFAVDTRVLTGSSLTTTIKSTTQANHLLLKKYPEIEKIVTKIGSGEIPTDPMSMEASDLMVILKPKKEWTSAETFDELAEKMGKTLEDIPGITVGFQFPVQMRFNELMTGGRQDVICKIFGENLDTLALYAERIGNLAGKVNGAKDIYVETVTGLPQIVVEYNRAALNQFGLSINEVNQTLQAAFAGAVAGQVFENERRFDLVVRLADNSRTDLGDVQNLLIATPGGEQVPLQQLARIAIKEGPNQIQRENAQRRISVGFNVRGNDVETVVQQLQQNIDQTIVLPAGYFITYGGAFENLLAAKNRLAIAVPVSLLMIFLLLYFAFNSIAQGLLIFTAIPLSAIGGIVALWLRDMPFSISAGVGFIALFGVAVLNGIVLITEFNNLKKSGLMDVRERVLKGTEIRLRPVLMTAAVASFGFLPMALSNGAGAEVQRPLATVVIGGLITATLLTLLVLPVLYRWLETRQANPKTKPSIVQPTLPILLLLAAGFLFSPRLANAQQTVTLPNAVQQALQQNLQVQAANLRTIAATQIQGSAYDIPQTNFVAEYGKINSAYNDTRFGVVQNISFPIVYKRQQQLFKAHTQNSFLNEQAIRFALQKQVTLLYSEMQIAQERLKLLSQSDSLFQVFLDRQALRFKAGDINILEKTSAETQRLQIANQVQQTTADFDIMQTQFARLLNSRNLLMPQAGVLQVALLALPDTTKLTSLPELKVKAQQKEIALQEVEVLKTKSLPQLSLGYYNQSFQGFQRIDGAEKFFGGSDRFSLVSAGVNVSIFNKANKARLQAGQTNYEMVQVEYRDALLQQQVILQQLLLQYGRNQRTLQYYEQTALKQAQVIMENANLQFNNGAINYIEFILLVNQSIAIRSGYLDALSDWNSTVVELNSISTLP